MPKTEINALNIKLKEPGLEAQALIEFIKEALLEKENLEEENRHFKSKETNAWQKLKCIKL